jgi:hypothetical protein
MRVLRRLWLRVLERTLLGSRFSGAYLELPMDSSVVDNEVACWAWLGDGVFFSEEPPDVQVDLVIMRLVAPGAEYVGVVESSSI